MVDFEIHRFQDLKKLLSEKFQEYKTNITQFMEFTQILPIGLQ